MSIATVLVCDKNRKFLEKTAEILEGAGYEMLAAQDAGEAKEMLAYHKPDVVLLNARIPGDSGYDLCRYVKSDIDRATPVVLMFSRDDEGTTNVMVESGADNYIVRPLKRQELLFCVRDMLKLRRLHEEVTRANAEIERLRKGEQELLGGHFYSFDVFKRLLFVEIKRAKRYNLPLSAMIIALDGVDAVLASNGAEILAKLREAVAMAIRRSIRDTDIPVAFRQGNILIVMPHTDEKGARVVADRIQARMRRSVYRGEGFVLRPTMSVGATTSAAGRALSFGEMILGATLALREAQRAGGDRVVFA
jgi:diguanylate cyclase (GGDEF)-like protein